MNFRPLNSSRANRAKTAAFSLLEVIVVSGLLSVIILGLVLMFSQTQRAYKLGTTQVDVLEGGRMVADIMSRDLVQVTPSHLPMTNFQLTAWNYQPLAQPLAGSLTWRTNLLQDVFFVTRENQKYSIIGYFVRTNDNLGNLGFPQAGVGSLYRFETNVTETALKLNPNFYWNAATNAAIVPDRASRILEGIVSFKVRAFDTAGAWISSNRSASIYTITNTLPADVSGYPFGETGNVYFRQDAVPASVEVEITVLESKEIERARSISDATARANYLSQQAAKAHVFRWRVPVRNVDTAAYQ